MYIRMKQYVDLFLLAVLIIFLYDIPEFLNDIVNNTLGKLALLGGVVTLLYKVGNTSGILAALIYILLIHKKKEGFSVSFGITREGMTKDGNDDDDEGEKSSDKKGDEALKKKVKRLEKNQKKLQKEMDKKKDGGKDEEEKEKKEDEEEEEDGKESFKNFSNSYHLKLNDLTEVNTVKGINFRNRTDMDRDIKISAEKNKIKATAARIDGTM